MATSQISKHPGGILDLRKEKLRPYSQTQLRAKVQVQNILRVLQDHVLNGTDIAHTRLTTGLALLKKVLPDALPESTEQKEQALAAIAQGQLYLMAQEMVRQGIPDASMLQVDRSTLAEDASVIAAIPAADKITTDDSE